MTSDTEVESRLRARLENERLRRAGYMGTGASVQAPLDERRQHTSAPYLPMPSRRPYSPPSHALEASTAREAARARNATRATVTPYTGPHTLKLDAIGRDKGEYLPAGKGEYLPYQSVALQTVTRIVLAGATGGVSAYALACEYAGMRPFLPLDVDGAQDYDLTVSALLSWLATPYGAQRWSGLLSAWAMQCLTHAEVLTLRAEVRSKLVDAQDSAPHSLHAMSGASWASYLQASYLAMLDTAGASFSDVPGDVSILLAYREAMDIQAALQRAWRRAAREMFPDTAQYGEMRAALARHDLATFANALAQAWNVAGYTVAHVYAMMRRYHPERLQEARAAHRHINRQRVRHVHKRRK